MIYKKKIWRPRPIIYKKIVFRSGPNDHINKIYIMIIEQKRIKRMFLLIHIIHLRERI